GGGAAAAGLTGAGVAVGTGAGAQAAATAPSVASADALSHRRREIRLITRFLPLVFLVMTTDRKASESTGKRPRRGHGWDIYLSTGKTGRNDALYELTLSNGEDQRDWEDRQYGRCHQRSPAELGDNGAERGDGPGQRGVSGER